MKPLSPLLAIIVTLNFPPSLQADSTGTGFFVSEDGYVVTNFHVVDGSSRLLVKHLDETLAAKIVAVDKLNDIALLKVPKSEAPYPHLFVDTASAPTPGSDVFTIGFPDPTVLGLTPKTTKGNITASAGIKDDPRFLQISVPIQPGNSGGPLIDPSGDVIGITTATINPRNRLEEAGYLPQNVNYALKSSYLKGVFDQVSDNTFTTAKREKAERKFTEIQRATQESVTLIIAISEAQQGPPTNVTPTQNQEPNGSKQIPDEQISPVTYIGNVGRLDAIFFLKWLPSGKIQGTYFYPKRGISKSYTLIGSNPREGHVYLEEYTENKLTARINLSKSITKDTILWSGKMDNLDGRSFEMKLSRDR